MSALTARQRDVLELIAHGQTNKEVAAKLGISPETVRTHVSAIIAALDVSNRTEAAAAFLTDAAKPSHVREVLRRPAIVVLPFQSISGDLAAKNVAAGIGRDITALLSRCVWFPVIAHSTSWSSGFGPMSAKDVGARLGARFVIDGALRRAGVEWRLDVQIADTHNGHILWAEHCDFPLEGVFAVQDQVTREVVARAYARLVSVVLSDAPVETSVEAWQLAHQGFSLQSGRERGANERSIDKFQAALRTDSTSVLAHYGLGLSAYDGLLNQWAEPISAMKLLERSIERCLECGPHAAEGHFLLARLYQSGGKHSQALAPLEVAIGLNPSFAAAHALLAQLLVMEGAVDAGIERMDHAARLDPRSSVSGRAVVHFARHAWADALEAAQHTVKTVPNYPFARALAAASAYWGKDRPRALEHARALRAIHPDFDAQQFLSTFGQNVDAVERIAKALEVLGKQP